MVKRSYLASAHRKLLSSTLMTLLLGTGTQGATPQYAANVGSSARMQTRVVEVHRDSCNPQRTIPPYGLDVVTPVDVALRSYSAGGPSALPITVSDTGNWIPSHAKFSGADVNLQGPMGSPTLIGDIIASGRSFYDLSLSDAGIITASESGTTTNLSNLKFTWPLNGKLSWDASEKVDLNSGADDWHIHATLEASYRIQGRLLSCKFNATLDASATGKRSVTRPAAPPPQDCIQRFEFNLEAKPTDHKSLDYAIEGDMLHIYSGNKDFPPFGIAFTDPVGPGAPAPNEFLVMVQNMTVWKGTATYGTEPDATHLTVPPAPPAPFPPPPWLDKKTEPPPPYYQEVGSTSVTINDSPDLQIPLRMGDRTLTRVDFTKEFKTFFGCSNRVTDRKLPEDDPGHWIRTMANLTWGIHYAGDVRTTPGKDAPVFYPDADARVYDTGYKLDPTPPVVIGPLANCVQNIDKPISPDAGELRAPGGPVDVPKAIAICHLPREHRPFPYGPGRPDTTPIIPVVPKTPSVP